MNTTESEAPALADSSKPASGVWKAREPSRKLQEHSQPDREPCPTAREHCPTFGKREDTNSICPTETATSPPRFEQLCDRKENFSATGIVGDAQTLARSGNEGQGESDANYLLIACLTPIEHFGGSPTGPRM